MNGISNSHNWCLVSARAAAPTCSSSSAGTGPDRQPSCEARMGSVTFITVALSLRALLPQPAAHHPPALDPRWQANKRAAAGLAAGCADSGGCDQRSGGRHLGGAGRDCTPAGTF